jgi:hypothetical protein
MSILSLQGSNAQQFLRVCTLLVSNRAGSAVDLSALRIKFAVKRSDTMTPNMADIRVYNVDASTAQFIQKEFTTVILQGGYGSNFGGIFKGNIKQVILGRENATDTFVDIVAGDGDRAYNFAIVNATLRKGSTQNDHLNAAFTPMAPHGVQVGYVGNLPPVQLPRGKVMYGNSRDYIKCIADSSGFGWSIQDEKINFIKQTTYLPGTAVVLTSKTGLIGTPQQTNEGVNCKCLLNPLIKIGGRIQLDNASIEQFKINLSVPNSAANIPAPLTADGVYYVLVVEHVGDTRGNDWYSNLVTLNVDVTSNPINSVQVGYGGVA